MADQKDFEAIFKRLRSILEHYAPRMTLIADQADNYCLDTLYSEHYKKTIFFGAAKIKKIYVSFHLMPVYMYPDLLQGMSPELRKRMQGKSCFNFNKLDETLVDELTTLTQKGFDRYHEQKLD